MIQNLYKTLGCLGRNDQKRISKLLAIPLKELDFFDKNHILPENEILLKIKSILGIDMHYIMLRMGIYSIDLMEKLAKNADKIIAENPIITPSNGVKTIAKPNFSTKNGDLYKIDCLELLGQMQSESVDMVFADPPFNLNKIYKSKIDDNLHDYEYFSWCLKWLDECVRILKKGGSLFIWNLPKWNSKYSNYLQNRLTFKNWIAVDMKNGLPIQNRLFPSHYSLLYFIKGEKANTFKPDRMPMETCPKCIGDLKDYGGYKNKMNPSGINLTDVWYDIPPVRHSKYKKRVEANELSIKLLDRIFEMSTEEGNVVFDPFGGSGTTFIVAELKGRKWIGTELDPLDTIIERFSNIEEEKKFIDSIRDNYNRLFPLKIKAQRKKRGLWTDDTFLLKSNDNLLF